MLFSGEHDDSSADVGDADWRRSRPGFRTIGEVDDLLAYFARQRRRDSWRRWLLCAAFLVNLIIAAGWFMGYLPFFCLT